MSRRGQQKIDPLNRRIPENPRYKHVKSKLDTGASASKYTAQLEEMRKNYRYRKDEIFKRMKATTFAQLVLQVHEEAMIEHSFGSSSDGEDAVREGATPQQQESSPLGYDDSSPEYQYNSSSSSSYPSSPPGTARSTLCNLVSGVGEMDLLSPRDTPSLSPSPLPSHSSSLTVPNCPYLLLDVRDKESYDKCHIVTAQSYPSTTLCKSCNYFTREMYEYRNKPGKIIIMYDEDELTASGVATKFVQRDVNNVFMLSGGLKVLFKLFSEGLITGVIPQSCRPTPPPSSRRRTSSSQTTARTKPPTEHHTPCKDHFTPEDLLAIQRQLDEALLSSVSTSRASSRYSVTSSRPTTDSRAVSSPAWK